MPQKVGTPCNQFGCPEIVNGRFCEKHRKEYHRKVNSRRNKTNQGMYGGRWQKARNIFLANNPFCAECSKDGATQLASVVDHIEPHRGNFKLFWDESNWQPLCKSCHDRKTATEDGGFGNKKVNHVI